MDSELVVSPEGLFQWISSFSLLLGHVLRWRNFEREYISAKNDHFSDEDLSKGV